MRSSYRQYLLLILVAILAFNFVDRVALGVMLPEIGTDLALSDTELGLLSGIAFALFYSVMGIPIARWADRGNRVTIVWLTTAIWSVAVAACGLALSFPQLLLIRVGVAVGEAGCTPPAFSLIADYFDRQERPRAVAIYGLGVPLGSILAFFAAGWLAQLYGWRTTFILLGAPGVVLAVVAKTVLREPRAENTERPIVNRQQLVGSSSGPPLMKALRKLIINRTFRYLLLCLSTQFFFAYGILTWLPTYFVRSFGMGVGSVGTWLALSYGLGGLAGSYLGGEIASRYAAGNERLQLKMMAAFIVAAGIASMAAYFSRSAVASCTLIALSTICLGTVNAPLFATVQTLVPADMRAAAVALLYLCGNLVGLGLGPIAAGVLSDALSARLGGESLRYALLLLAPGYFWVAWYAVRASQSVESDLAYALNGAAGTQQWSDTRNGRARFGQ